MSSSKSSHPNLWRADDEDDDDSGDISAYKLADMRQQLPPAPAAPGASGSHSSPAEQPLSRTLPVRPRPPPPPQVTRPQPPQLTLDQNRTNEQPAQTTSSPLGKRRRAESSAASQASPPLDSQNSGVNTAAGVLTAANGVRLLAPGTTSTNGTRAEIWNVFAEGLKPGATEMGNRIFEGIMKAGPDPEGKNKKKKKNKQRRTK